MTPHDRSSRILASITLALLTACSPADDEPAEPSETHDATSAAAEEECLAAVEQIECAPGQGFFALWGQGELSMISADDPDATIELPGGVLIEVSSDSEFVGGQHVGGEDCAVGCGWCGPGQSWCHEGSPEDGSVGCAMCLGWDSPDPEGQCAMFLQACGMDEG